MGKIKNIAAVIGIATVAGAGIYAYAKQTGRLEEAKARIADAKAEIDAAVADYKAARGGEPIAVPNGCVPKSAPSSAAGETVATLEDIAKEAGAEADGKDAGGDADGEDGEGEHHSEDIEDGTAPTLDEKLGRPWGFFAFAGDGDADVPSFLMIPRWDDGKIDFAFAIETDKPGVREMAVSDAIAGDVSSARFDEGGKMYLTFSVTTDDGISFWRADEGKLIRLSSKPGVAFAKDEYALKPIAQELPVSAK